MRNVVRSMPDHRLAVHILFFQDIKLFANGFVYISKEGIREIVLFAELLLRLGRVAGDAEHDGAGVLDFFELVAKAAGLDGAAGRIGFGIEEEDDRLAGEILQMDGLLRVVLERKVGNFVVDFHYFPSKKADECPRTGGRLKLSCSSEDYVTGSHRMF